MSRPRVVALDLSLSCTGVADERGVRAIRPAVKGMARLDWMRHEIFRGQWSDVVAAETGVGWPDLYVIEGYSMGTARQNSHAHALGELGGVVRLELWEAGIPHVDVPPSSLKKYATGKGNASKSAVLVAATKRLGYDGYDDNEADALWLWHMAMDALGFPVVQVPQDHRTGLDKIAWPDIVFDAEEATV